MASKRPADESRPTGDRKPKLLFVTRISLIYKSLPRTKRKLCTEGRMLNNNSNKHKTPATSQWNFIANHLRNYQKISDQVFWNFSIFFFYETINFIIFIFYSDYFNFSRNNLVLLFILSLWASNFTILTLNNTSSLSSSTRTDNAKFHDFLFLSVPIIHPSRQVL